MGISSVRERRRPDATLFLMSEAFENPNVPKKPSRRDFLRSLGALASAAALPTAPKAQQRDSTPIPEPNDTELLEREATIEKVLASFQNPETKRILESGTDEELHELLTRFPPYMCDVATGYYSRTKYDPMPHIIGAGYPTMHIGTTPVEELLEGKDPVAFGNLDQNTVPNDPAGGQGFVMRYEGGKNIVLTNKHVNDVIQLPEITELPDEFDIAAVRVPFVRKEIPVPLEWDGKDASTDITGSLVYNYVAKSDPLSPEKFRIRVGIAMKMTPHLLTYLFRKKGLAPQPGENEYMQRLQNSYAVTSTALEQAEVASLFFDGTGGFHKLRSTLAHGTSGSPYERLRPDGTFALTGIHFAGILIEAQDSAEKPIALSFMHGPDALQRVIDTLESPRSR